MSQPQTKRPERAYSGESLLEGQFARSANNLKSMLLEAAKFGNIQNLKTCLKAFQDPALAASLERLSIDVNARDSTSKTALMLAAENGKTEAVKELLAVAGIYINTHDSTGKTALMLAAENCHMGALKVLLAAPGIRVNYIANSDYGTTALMFAAKNGHTGAVKELLAAPGIDVNAEYKYGGTALTLAAEKGHTGAVKELLAVPPAEPGYYAAVSKHEKVKVALMLAKDVKTKALIKDYIDNNDPDALRLKDAITRIEGYGFSAPDPG